MKDKLVVVIEKMGFCTTKLEEDVLPSDEIIFRPNSIEEAEGAIHGKYKNQQEIRSDKLKGLI